MSLPRWLLAEERYSPPSDKDSFVDRSILSFLRLLSRARSRRGREENGIRIEPLFKVLAAFVFVLLVSLGRSTVFLLLAAACLLVVVASQRARRVASVLETGAAVTVFTFLILLPSLFGDGAPMALTMAAKVFLSVSSVRLVSVTTEWSSLSAAFKRLGLPDLFILVFDIALKYIALLGEFALAMLYALRLRSVGRNADKAASLSGIAGTLFIKSKEMAEEMYAAMECRGFTGEYMRGGAPRLGLWELAITLAIAALVAAYFVLPRTR